MKKNYREGNGRDLTIKIPEYSGMKLIIVDLKLKN
jgi:hypothetical protein